MTLPSWKSFPIASCIDVDAAADLDAAVGANSYKPGTVLRAVNQFRFRCLLGLSMLGLGGIGS